MTEHPGFVENPEQRPVKAVRTVRFERWQAITVRNPEPKVEPVDMQFEGATVDGMPGVVGRATVRGALYAIGLTLHDIAWLLTEAERQADLTRAREAYRG